LKEIRFPIEAEVPFSANTLTPALYSTQPSGQWVLKLKQNKLEASHSSPFGAEIKKCRQLSKISCYTTSYAGVYLSTGLRYEALGSLPIHSERH